MAVIVSVVILLLSAYIYYISRAGWFAQRGNTAYAQGRMEQALSFYKKAYYCRNCPQKHQLGYGYLLMRTGNPDQAEEIFQHILQKAKRRDVRQQSQCNLATVYWLQGKKAQAIALLEEVFAQYKNTMVYGNLGYFKILHGDLNDALTFNLEAYAYNSEDKAILDNLALNYYLLGQLEQAEEMFAKLIPKSPSNGEAHYYYALTLRQLGKLQEADNQMALALGKKLSFVTPLTCEEIEQTAMEWKQAKV